MFRALNSSGPLSRFGRNLAIGTAMVALLCTLGEGLLYGALPSDIGDPARFTMFRTWLTGFSYLSQQLIYVGALLFVGAKFLEGRTLFTVGFSNLDADKMRVQGPDENNTVWVGQRYGSKFEAESMAVALQSRLEASQRTA